MEHIITILAKWIEFHITALGYPAVAAMMAIESACIPLPSEVIMPFSGYMVLRSPDRFSLLGVGVAGAIGCVIGSIVAYYAGLYGGRPFVERYGKYILIRPKDMDKADRFFNRYGNAAIFISRLLPVVRTFISFPAGVARMNVPKFVLYTFLGSLPWCLALAYVGKALGAKWDTIRTYFHGADTIIVVFCLVCFALYLYHHLRPESPKGKTKGA